MTMQETLTKLIRDTRDEIFRSPANGMSPDECHAMATRLVLAIARGLGVAVPPPPSALGPTFDHIKEPTGLVMRTDYPVVCTVRGQHEIEEKLGKVEPNNPLAWAVYNLLNNAEGPVAVEWVPGGPRATLRWANNSHVLDLEPGKPDPKDYPNAVNAYTKDARRYAGDKRMFSHPEPLPDEPVAPKTIAALKNWPQPAAVDFQTEFVSAEEIVRAGAYELKTTEFVAEEPLRVSMSSQVLADLKVSVPPAEFDNAKPFEFVTVTPTVYQDFPAPGTKELLDSGMAQLLEAMGIYPEDVEQAAAEAREVEREARKGHGTTLEPVAKFSDPKFIGKSYIRGEVDGLLYEIHDNGPPTLVPFTCQQCGAKYDEPVETCTACEDDPQPIIVGG